MGTWTHSLHQETDGDESLLKRDDQPSTMKLKEVVSCTCSGCRCQCFLPGPNHIRSCDRCAHGWVHHAVSKVCVPAQVCSGQVEIVQCSVVFDISSLILYGTQAIPVRMKILLDRLFSVLTHTQVLRIVHTLGWTLRDYVRGYMLQDSMGKVLDRWVSMTPEDEVVTLRQFLRFGETKSIVELMEEESCPKTTARAIEHSSVHHSLSFKPRDKLHHFENLPGGNLAFLQPFHYISSSLLPPSPALEHHRATQKLQRLSKQKNSADGRESEMRSRNRRSTSLRIDCTKSTKHKEPHQAEVNVDSPGERERRHGTSLSKGRVSCDACAKTFYDKGTLKIHFNAVHLKIKHRCTIDGCNMMFSSLRSRNRHSANPNPRLHAAVEHTTRRFTAHPRQPVLPGNTPSVSMTANNIVLTEPQKHLPDVFDTQKTSEGGSISCSANQNSGIHMTPKKKSRKSSTPLKIRRDTHHENRSDDDDDDDYDHLTLSPMQPFNSLHDNQPLTTNTCTQHNYKHLCKTLCGYQCNSHMGERNDWMQRELPGAHDKWKTRCRPLLKVKEERCDPSWDSQRHCHSDL